MPESAESLPEPLSEVLPGRVAVVTGASRGIGTMTARALAGDGYAVCLFARDGSAGGKVADEIRSRGQSAAMARSADVTDDVAVRDAVNAVRVLANGAEIANSASSM